MEGVELGQTCDERTEAVARIVHRRRRASVRLREAASAYSVHRGERGPGGYRRGQPTGPNQPDHRGPDTELPTPPPAPCSVRPGRCS